MTDASTETATRTEVIAAEPVESLAGVLGIDVPLDEVPIGWQIMYLIDRRPQAELGPDGHPTSGIPAPPGEGRRRMFAGGRVTTLRRLRIGQEATRTTAIVSTKEKEGRTGPLTFVTVRHETTQDGQVCIVEEQDIVYRAPGTSSLPAAKAPDEPIPSREARLDLDVDERLLFRFSALTYNTHRIHYDPTWCAVEGYDGLVVHGPLQALLMADIARREGVDLLGREFAYRLVSPMVGPQTLSVLAAEDGLAAGAEVRSAAGVVTATSTFGQPG